MANYCHYCGSKIQPEWNVCSACGTPLDQDQPSQPIQPVQTDQVSQPPHPNMIYCPYCQVYVFRTKIFSWFYFCCCFGWWYVLYNLLKKKDSCPNCRNRI